MGGRAVLLMLCVALVAGCTAMPPAGSNTPPQDSQRSRMGATSTPPAQTPLEITTTARVPYAPDRWLTVFAPSDQGPWPIAIVYHGLGMEPEDMYDLARDIARRGAVVMVPQWAAVRPESHAAQAVARGWHEAAAAVRFARNSGARWGGDTSRVIVVGFSWGASAAATIALSGDAFTATGTDLGSSGMPDGCVVLDGPMDIRVLVPEGRYDDQPEAWNRINPQRVLANSPSSPTVPFRLLLGGAWPESDRANREFARSVRRQGGDVAVTVLGRSHLEMAAPADETLDAVFELANR